MGEAKKEFEQTCKFIKDTLGDSVDKVEVSSRLTTSPSALVQPQWGMSPQMQRFMKAQAASSGGDMSGMMSGMSANLELNPQHPAVKKMKTIVEGSSEGGSDYARLLYEVAAISSGYEVQDPAAFAKRVVQLMAGDNEADEPPSASEIQTSAEDAPIMPEVIEED